MDDGMLFARHLLHDEQYQLTAKIDANKRTLEPEEDFDATMECFASHLLHDNQYDTSSPTHPHHSTHHLKDNYIPSIPKSVTPKKIKKSNDILSSLSYAGHYHTSP